MDDCPYLWEGTRISVYHAASAAFYAPSEHSNMGGMRREMIRSTPLWWNEYPRYDTVLVSIDEDALGMDGMQVARVHAFLSFKHEGCVHQCALVEWFEREDDRPDDVTGMWIVRREYGEDGDVVLDVIPIASIVRACHLIGVYGTTRLPDDFHFSDSLDAFRRYYLNWYVDYHAHEAIC